MKILANERLNANDSSYKDKIEELNLGAEGKPAVNVNGKPIPRSVYLGKGNLAYVDGGNIKIQRYSLLKQEYNLITIYKEEFPYIKRLM